MNNPIEIKEAQFVETNTINRVGIYITQVIKKLVPLGYLPNKAKQFIVGQMFLKDMLLVELELVKFQFLFLLVLTRFV